MCVFKYKSDLFFCALRFPHEIKSFYGSDGGDTCNRYNESLRVLRSALLLNF